MTLKLFGTFEEGGGGGAGLTPAQVEQLNKSGIDQGAFDPIKQYLANEKSDEGGSSWIKLNNSAATGLKPYDDLTNWSWVEGGDYQVTSIPPQGTVTTNYPAFIFDTVNTKRYRLDTSTPNPIYVPADGSTSTGGGSTAPVYPDGQKITYQ